MASRATRACLKNARRNKTRPLSVRLNQQRPYSMIIAPQFLSRLTLLLIPAVSAHTNQHLPATGGCVEDDPVVAAPQLKGHIENGELLCHGRVFVAIHGGVIFAFFPSI